MAICGRCGQQTDSAGEVCPNCSEYASASSPAAAHAQPEFAALPHFERPFAARGTVWPADPLLAPSLPNGGSPDADPADGRPTAIESAPADPELHHPELSHPEQGDPEHDHAKRGQPEHGHPEHDYPEPASTLGLPGLGDPGRPDSEPADLGHATLLPENAASDTANVALGLTDPAAGPRSGRWIALTAANAVLLLTVAGAVTMVLRHEQASQAARLDRPSATARPPGSTSPSEPPLSRQLEIYPAAATVPDAATIAASLTRYFDAINNHDYTAYKRSFILALRSKISASSFSTEFSATTDANEQVHSISPIGSGRVDALVTFVSQQPTVDNPGHPTCAAWSMEFSFGRRGSRYLLIAPPQWFQVSDTSCA